MYWNDEHLLDRQTFLLCLKKKHRNTLESKLFEPKIIPLLFQYSNKLVVPKENKVRGHMKKLRLKL